MSFAGSLEQFFDLFTALLSWGPPAKQKTKKKKVEEIQLANLASLGGLASKNGLKSAQSLISGTFKVVRACYRAYFVADVFQYLAQNFVSGRPA